MTTEQINDLAVELYEAGLCSDKHTAQMMANDPRNWPEKE